MTPAMISQIPAKATVATKRRARIMS